MTDWTSFSDREQLAAHHIQTAPEPHPAIVCGNRETRADGNYECVRPPAHVNLPCYFVRLVVRGRT